MSENKLFNEIRWNLIPQTGARKKKILGSGILIFDKETAVFWDGDAGWDSHILGTLEKAEIIFITSGGVMIKGFEHIGNEKNGTKKYRYTEWYCPFVKK